MKSTPARRGVGVLPVVCLLFSVSIALWVFFGGGSNRSGRTKSVFPAALATIHQQQFSSRQYRNIEDIRVGQRVITPDTDASKILPTRVDPATWKLVTLQMMDHWQDGTVDQTTVRTIQSPQWMAQNGVAVGAKVHLPVDLKDLTEPDHLADVVSVDACPPIEQKPGRVVLSTITHLSNFLFDLTVRDAEGHSKLIEVTGGHKLYSEGRQWTSTCELVEGEILRGHDGPLKVMSLVRHPGTVPVYNMTVEDEHVYYVSSVELLSHNVTDCRIANLQKDKGITAGPRISYEDALEHIMNGGDVLAPNQSVARDLARAAGGGNQPILEKGDVGPLHYHPKPRTGSHIWWTLD